MAEENTLNDFYNEWERNPKSEIFARIAHGHWLKGELDKAVDICNEGLKENPNYANGYLVLGKCYNDKEDYENALSCFDTVLSLDRRNHVALKLYGDILISKGEIADGLEKYAQILFEDPLNKKVLSLFEEYKENVSQEDIKPFTKEIISASLSTEITKATTDKKHEKLDVIDVVSTDEISSEAEDVDVIGEEVFVYDDDVENIFDTVKDVEHKDSLEDTTETDDTALENIEAKENSNQDEAEESPSSEVVESDDAVTDKEDETADAVTDNSDKIDELSEEHTTKETDEVNESDVTEDSKEQNVKDDAPDNEEELTNPNQDEVEEIGVGEQIDNNAKKDDSTPQVVLHDANVEMETYEPSVSVDNDEDNKSEDDLIDESDGLSEIDEADVIKDYNEDTEVVSDQLLENQDDISDKISDSEIIKDGDKQPSQDGEGADILKEQESINSDSIETDENVTADNENKTEIEDEKSTDIAEEESADESIDFGNTDIIKDYKQEDVDIDIGGQLLESQDDISDEISDSEIIKDSNEQNTGESEASNILEEQEPTNSDNIETDEDVSEVENNEPTDITVGESIDEVDTTPGDKNDVDAENMADAQLTEPQDKVSDNTDDTDIVKDTEEQTPTITEEISIEPTVYDDEEDSDTKETTEEIYTDSKPKNSVKKEDVNTDKNAKENKLDKKESSEIVDEDIFNEDSNDRSINFEITDGVASSTLAELFYKQGQHKQAIKIYKFLLSKSPDNKDYSDRIKTIKEEFLKKQRQ